MTNPLKSVRRCDYYRLKRQWNKEKSAPSRALLEDCQRSTLEKKRRKSLNIDCHYNEQLPIIARRKEIVETIRSNQVLILSGETGSGKTTQIPKFCLEAGRGIEGKIGCTQPRRIAALTVAERIADELQNDKLVGSKIRFQDREHPQNFIKLMTDGILLAETQSDPWLNQYDTLIIDEAHERSLNIDFLLGILKELTYKRKDLKLIITSATIDTEKFSQAFDDAPVIEVSGRTFPVEVRYNPPESDDASLAEQSWDALEEILSESTDGDVLVFLPTEQDIREAIDLGNKKDRKNLLLLPLYARLSSREQKTIFQSSPDRKIIFSTNIAETSLTIPGIRFVVDSGFARIARYSPGSGTFGLPVEAVSQSSADQRKGRCGRIAEGVCIRLYSEEDYQGRSQYTQPEILRTNLAEVILRMLSLRITDIEGFPFVDSPSSSGILDGFKTLIELNAVNKSTNGYRLTPLGREMAAIPADPRLSRMLLQSRNEGCLYEAMVMVGALSIQDPRERPREQSGKAKEAQSIFIHPESDFLTLLNIWRKWESTKGSWSKRLKNLSRDYYLSYRKMKEWVDLVQQLHQMGKDRNWRSKSFTGDEEALNYALHRSIVSGFLSHVSRKKDPRSYEATRNRQAYIFPGSVLFKNGGTWLVSAEMIKTTKFYLRINANIDPKWLLELGSHLIKARYLEPRWDEKTATVLAREELRLFQFILSRDNWKPYGPINPREAREIFIRQGLLEGFAQNTPNFLKRNRKTRDLAARIENKLRKRGFLNENAEWEHYDRILPDISSLSELQLYIKEKGDKKLIMKEEDFYANLPDKEDIESLPDYLVKGEERYRISYKFDPGSKEDGPTLLIPQEKAENWSSSDSPLIQGYLFEQIEAYLKGLPKEWRKKLIPIAQHADVIEKEMEISADGLEESLCRFIYKKWNLAIPRNLFDPQTLPEYITLKYALTGNKGKVLRQSNRLSDLLERPDKQLDKSSLEEWNNLKGIWISDWKELSLPEKKIIQWKGKEWQLFPCLKKEKSGIRKVWASTRADAEQYTQEASAELFHKHFKKQIKSISNDWNWGSLKSYLVHFKDYQEWIHRLWLNFFMSQNISSCRNEQEFEEKAKKLAPVLMEEASEKWNNLINAVTVYRDWRDYLKTARSKSHEPQQAFLSKRELEGEALFENFMQDEDSSDLEDYPRILRCLKSRTEKGLLAPSKDQERENEWREYYDKGNELRENLSPHASREKKELIREYFYLLREYNFLLFCQEEKKKIKVSPKRLNILLEKIRQTP